MHPVPDGAWSRLRFQRRRRGRDPYETCLVIADRDRSRDRLPGVVILIPYVVLFYRLKLNDKLIALVITNLAGGIPMGTLMIRGFINGVPIELEEAARIDGANHWQIIGRVIFPLIRPGIVTVSILTFVGAWNALLLPVLLMNDDDMYTIAVGLYWRFFS